MSGIEFNVDAALAKLGELIAKHGPQAVDVAAAVVKINAIGNLIGGGVLLLAGCGLGYGASRAALAAVRESQKDYREQNEAVGIIGALGGTVGAVLALMAFVGGAVMLSDVWSWAALFNPKLALAHEILTRFAGIR